MTDRWLREECETLRLQVAELRDRLDAIQGAYGAFALPGDELLHLTGLERSIAKIMHDRIGHVVSKTGMHTVLYGLRGDSETPDIKIIDVLVCKLRAKLKGSSYRIETQWGAGYRLVRATEAEAA